MSKKTPMAPQVMAHTLALPLCGVDSHAHLDSSQFDRDREEVLARAKECGIAHIGNIFLKPHEFVQRAAYFDAHPEVFFALGVHPCDGEECDDAALEAMREHFLREPRLKAVGEIGLDFYWDACSKDVQLHVFVQQLHLAKELQKPVIIHSRDATEATIALLEKEGFKDYPLLWHCFGGTVAHAKHIVHNGWHVSIPGPVTYPKNEELREAVKYVPLDKLMLETDCPYLSPQQWRGKRNEPAYTVFTVDTMAATREMPAAQLWQICGENARRFFGLGEFS